MTYSKLINNVIAMAVAEGNYVEQIATGWTKVREVAYMALPMSKSLRDRLSEDHRLRYWSADATPHNRAENGFTDDIDRVSIAFPL